jgi:hypothetical protein
MRSSRAVIVLAAAFAVVLATGGAFGIALYALPFVVLAALLLTGRFVGEDRILAFWRSARVRTRRPVAPRWLPARPALALSLFARAPRSFRGPPALLSI